MLDVIARGFNAHLGLELVSAEKDRVMARLDAGKHHLTADDRVHGGVIMALADAVAAHGTILNLPENATTTTIESKTNFIRGAKAGMLFAEALPVHIGRSTLVWQTTVRDSENSVLAIVIQTQIVLNRSEPVAGPDPAHVAASGFASQATLSSSKAEGASEDYNGHRSTAERRRAQILDAAFKVISRKGFANSSMREIAQEAGMPVPTMYQYLRSKDEILASIFDEYLGQVETSVRVSTAGPVTASEKLKAALAANMAEFDRFQAQVRMMTRETRSLEPHARERVKKHMFDYIDLFRSMIAQGIEAEEFRPVDPDLYANFIAMLCEVWPLRQWSVGRHGLATVQAGIIDFVLNGLREQERVSA